MVYVIEAQSRPAPHAPRTHPRRASPSPAVLLLAASPTLDPTLHSPTHPHNAHRISSHGPTIRNPTCQPPAPQGARPRVATLPLPYSNNSSPRHSQPHTTRPTLPSSHPSQPPAPQLPLLSVLIRVQGTPNPPGPMRPAAPAGVQSLLRASGTQPCDAPASPTEWFH